MNKNAERIEAIRTREDLAAFVEDLCKDLSEHPASWQNRDLLTFLEALSAWVRDMDGYYLNTGTPVPSTPEWRTFAEILMAATMYE